MLEARHPRLGVAVIVRDVAERVLLGRRAKNPNRGKWVIPGGGVLWGEPWRVTAAREILEETHLEIRLQPDQTPYVYEIIEDGEHRVILYAQTSDYLGELKAGGDLSEVGFFSRGVGLPPDLSPHTGPVLRAVIGWYVK
jgi:ADP-ribose pyrophosphatase YjhB (NUDIX family)